MKKKLIKIIIVSLCASFVIGGGIFISGAAYLTRIKSYENLNDEQFNKKLSKQSVTELFDEINALSDEGVEYPELIDFAFALLEKLDNISESLLVNTISNKHIHANLRMLCTELLEQKLEDSDGVISLSEKSVAKLNALVLDESEDTSVRFRLIETLPENESTAQALETLAFDEDGTIAYRALQFLNFFAPERARPIAEGFIESGENIETGIDIINYQMSHSDNIAEKDEWVAYLVDLLEEVEDEPANKETEAASIKYLVARSLNALHYSTALYEIINSEYIDDEYKSYCVGDSKTALPVFLEKLENSPTDYDIEMIMKAVDINPLNTAELVEPLKTAIEGSEKTYDITELIGRVNTAVAEENSEIAALEAAEKLMQEPK